ncbi:MAG: hypothetical protein WAS07_10725 [Micropruina sp.]|nr:hypothetical protein [Micropruina sp.]
MYPDATSGSVEGSSGEEKESDSIEPCKQQRARAKKLLVGQYADDSYSILVQRFTSAAGTAEVLALAKQCSALLSERGIDEGVRIVAEGGTAGAIWRLTRRVTQQSSSDAHQVLVSYGNVVVVFLQRGTNPPEQFTNLLTKQVQDAAAA